MNRVLTFANDLRRSAASLPLCRRGALLGLAAAFLSGFAFLGIHQARLTFTGDEPRYTYYAVSFGAEGDFALSPERWFEYCKRSHLTPFLPGPLDGKASHSIVVPVAISLLTRVLPLPYLRLTSVAVGILAAFVLWQLLRRISPAPSRLALVLLFTFFSVPVIAYLTLIYPEIWLLTLVMLAMYLTEIASDKRTLHVITPLVILILPFIHIRCSLIAVGLFVNYLLRIRHAALPFWLKYGVPFAAAAAMGLLFLGYQLHFFGSLTGSATAVYTPSLRGLFDRLVIQLFELRHGLLTYSPIWCFGVGGLLHGCVTRHRLAVCATILLLLYAVTFVWGAASESFPARFWVPAMGFLSIGLMYWFTAAPLVWTGVASLPFALVTIVNSALFLKDGAMFIENRLYSRTYDYLFDAWGGGFNLGAFLPWDSFGHPTPHMEQSLAIAYRLAILAATVTAGAILILQGRRARIRLVTVTAIITVAGGLAAVTNIRKLNADQYRVTRGTQLDRPSIQLQFLRPTHVALLRFAEPRVIWPIPAYPGEFALTADSQANDATLRRGAPYVTLSYPHAIKSLSVSAPFCDSDHWTQRGFEVFVDGPARSLLRRFLHWLYASKTAS